MQKQAIFGLDRITLCSDGGLWWGESGEFVWDGAV